MKKWYIVELGESVNVAHAIDAQDTYEAKIKAIREYIGDDAIAIVEADPEEGWFEYKGYSWPDPQKYNYIYKNYGAWLRIDHEEEDFHESAIWFSDAPDEFWDEDGMEYGITNGN